MPEESCSTTPTTVNHDKGGLDKANSATDVDRMDNGNYYVKCSYFSNSMFKFVLNISM